MKKIVLFAFLFFTAILTASAQSDSDGNTDDTKPKSFQWGIKGGLAITVPKQISTTHSSSFASDKGYGYIGGFWARVGQPAVYFQPEVYVTSRNLIIHDTTAITKNGNYLGHYAESNNATFTSVDIPLLVGTSFGLHGIVVPHLHAGPVISLGFANQQTAGSVTATTSTTTEDIAHVNYKTINYGWQVGAGVDIWRFLLDVRYEGAFQKFNTYNGDELRFNQINISLGFRFSSL